MHTGYIWFVVNPENRDHLREINEARAAAFQDAVRALIRGGSRVVGALSALPRRVRGWRRARRTRAELAGLSDALLADIGLGRADIETVADAVRRAPDRDPLVTLGHRAGEAQAPTRALPIPSQVLGKPRPAPSHGRTGEGSPRRAA